MYKIVSIVASFASGYGRTTSDIASTRLILETRGGERWAPWTSLFLLLATILALVVLLRCVRPRQLWVLTIFLPLFSATLWWKYSTTATNRSHCNLGEILMNLRRWSSYLLLRGLQIATKSGREIAVASNLLLLCLQVRHRDLVIERRLRVDMWCIRISMIYWRCCASSIDLIRYKSLRELVF